ncbi:aldo/keto reductase [Bacillus safensis]|uniref:aldo/keto reductase n=1 Tax=Bacillus safensis TaxID=561879 RepID=UPI000468BB2A|nr:aldo/keto reductase [Bacillus safensis]
MHKVTLNNGVEMPLLGFGVFQISDLEQCEQAVTDALEAGYRLIDTASAYMNEEAVGRAIKRSGVPREELFITTKLWVQDQGYESAKKAFEVSLEKLGLDYLDLYLIHQPFNDYYGSWRAMEELYKEGKIRAIGVSNFYQERLVDLAMNSEIVPAVNQVETHPFTQQKAAYEVMKEYGVQQQSWGPFAEGQNDIFQNELLAGIGEKYGKTVAQVILRWHLQRGIVTIPKSVHKERMVENFNIWDFTLSDEDMASISTLDSGTTLIIDHHTADMAKMLNDWKIHG